MSYLLQSPGICPLCFPTPNVVLTIGFLNNNVESSLETYKENFDIVLVDDQTMSFPNSLLAEILSYTD